MSVLPVYCPKCGHSTIEIEKDEVDIGVGIQTRIIGLNCESCGQVSCCENCGGWENKFGDIEHTAFCCLDLYEDPCALGHE